MNDFVALEMGSEEYRTIVNAIRSREYVFHIRQFRYEAVGETNHYPADLVKTMCLLGMKTIQELMDEGLGYEEILA